MAIMSIKVLVADDSDIVRRGIRHILEAQPEVELVGEAADFGETIQMTNDLKPQVIVMDLHMPNETKVAPLDVKSHLNDGSLLLAISFWNEEEAKALAESFGAVALLDKTELSNKLIPTIMQLVLPNAGAAVK
jgi:chemotaxis response regulator CheB